MAARPTGRYSRCARRISRPFCRDWRRCCLSCSACSGPLRLGWLKHRHIAIARGIDPVSDEDIAAVTRKRKRKLALDPQLYEQNVFVPEFLEEVYDFPDGNFALFYRDRPIGMGFKKTDPAGRVRLFWIKRRDLLRFGNHWQDKVMNALQAAAIPRETYGNYTFLRA